MQKLHSVVLSPVLHTLGPSFAEVSPAGAGANGADDDFLSLLNFIRWLVIVT